MDVPDAAWNASALGVIRAPGVAVAAVMPCIEMAAAALTKTPPPLPCCSLLTLERELMGAEGSLPRCPRLVGVGEAVRVRELLRESARGEE